MSNKLTTGVYGSTNKTELDEKPDLDVAPVVEASPPGIPINQQDEQNGETCLNVTNKKKHWWQWSKQDQSAKPSDQEDSNLPQANWMGKLGTLQTQLQNLNKRI